MIPQQEKDRFLAKVTPIDGCLIWCGAISDSGYGSTWIGQGPNRRPISAHRLAWLIQRGNLQGTLRNTCGNRACVNPAHWYAEEVAA